MTHPPRKPAKSTWDEAACQEVIDQLWQLRQSMLGAEPALVPLLKRIDPSYRASARNLSHYLTLRQTDHRGLQEKLAELGLSSLGRSESNVMANVDKVLGILHRLIGQDWQPHRAEEPVGIKSSRQLLEKHTEELLGAAPPERAVRIMVTLPSEAASDFGLIRQLVVSGMDIARINCAHDGPAEWKAMAAHIRRAARNAGRPVRILMDLGGPKLRTGTVAPGPALLKLQPSRNEFGEVTAPAQVGLRAHGSAAPVPGAALHLGVDADWLAALREGNEIRLDDARGARRTLQVVRTDAAGVLVECAQTTYIVSTTTLQRKGKRSFKTELSEIPVREGVLHLSRGDTVRLTRDAQTVASVAAKGGRLTHTVCCTLPEVFAQVCVGERIWFDDGHIGAVIRRVEADWIEVEITHARDGGDKLASDKGINLPDSRLSLPALTDKDIEDLNTVVKLADLVGLSFVQQASDVQGLRERLRKLRVPKLGVMLKIETRRAFENLPELLFAAMQGKAGGVMIARGDLAVECGYERLAEVQEEILWAAEAAHMPVVWATQVLETLAKTGLPSRAEITDAAMGERAECVMLNKGPHIGEAMRMLDDILQRMQQHQDKKRSLLRALKAWQPVRS